MEIQRKLVPTFHVTSKFHQAIYIKKPNGVPMRPNGCSHLAARLDKPIHLTHSVETFNPIDRKEIPNATKTV